MEPLPGVFDILQYFKTILPLVETPAFDLLLLEACDVTNNGRHFGFYQELEIRLKPREMLFFCALYEK